MRGFAAHTRAGASKATIPRSLVPVPSPAVCPISRNTSCHARADYDEDVAMAPRRGYGGATSSRDDGDASSSYGGRGGFSRGGGNPGRGGRSSRPGEGGAGDDEPSSAGGDTPRYGEQSRAPGQRYGAAGGRDRMASRAPSSRPDGRGYRRPSDGSDSTGGDGARNSGGYSRQGSGEGGQRPRGSPEDGERRTWQGPRSALTPEQQASRKEMVSAIQAAKGWRALGTLLEAKGTSMDAENISQILYKVASDRRPENPDDVADFNSLLSALLGWVLALLPTFRSKQVLMCMDSLAYMELFNDQVVPGLMEKAATQLGNLYPADVALLLTSCAKLNYQPTQEWQDKFFGWTDQKVRDYYAADLVAILGALVQLSITPATAWMDSCAAGCLKQAPYLRTKDLVSVTLSLASISKGSGWQPSQELVDALLTANVSKLDFGLKVPDYAQLLWAVSNFSARPGAQWFQKIDLGLVMAGRFWDLDNGSTICMLLGHYLKQPMSPKFCERAKVFLTDNMIEMTVEQIGSLLSVMAVSGYRPPDIWMDNLLIHLKSVVSGSNSTLLGLEMIYTALPALGEGMRLSQVLTTVATLYNEKVEAEAAQTPQEGAEA